MFEPAAQLESPHVQPPPQEATVFHVDDDQQYLDLTATWLKRNNENFSVVSEVDPTAAPDRIESIEPDCIVSDYDMPRMDGLELHAELRDRGIDCPFILFTGKGSESIASKAMSADVTDYIQKGGTDVYDLLANRISDAVESRHHRRLARQAIDHYRELVENSHLPVYQYDRDGTIQYANSPTADLYGVDTVDELVGRQMQEFLTEAESLAVEERTDTLAAGELVPPAEFQLEGADGQQRIVRATCVPTPHAKDAVGQTIAHHVTLRRQQERETNAVRNAISAGLEGASVGLWVYNISRETVTRYGIAELLGVTDEGLGPDPESFFQYVHPEDRDWVTNAYRQAAEEQEAQTLTFRIETEGGDDRRVTDRISVVTDNSDKVTHLAGVIQAVSGSELSA